MVKSLEYRIIRSSRRTLCLEIKNGELLVRAPKRISESKIEEFVKSKSGWIEKHLAKAAAMPMYPKLTAQEIYELAIKAKEDIPRRVEHFSKILGVTYGKITIRNQKTRWGSCSSKGNLNFNCLLMLTPSEVIDSVVVHELCHRKYMNHSKEFYALVKSVLPDYDSLSGWLSKNGRAIMLSAQ